MYYNVTFCCFFVLCYGDGVEERERFSFISI